MTIKRILVPIDFSSTSLAALDSAVAFAKPLKAEVVLLHVVEPVFYAMSEFAAPGMSQLLEQEYRSDRAQIARLAERCAKRQVKTRGLVQVGTAYQAIVDTAKKVHADMIVMATHGRTGLPHFLLGSVAERVVRLAACPVLTIRTGKKGRRPAAHTAAQRRAKTARTLDRVARAWDGVTDVRRMGHRGGAAAG